MSDPVASCSPGEHRHGAIPALSQAELGRAEQLFRAMGDSARLRLLTLLAGREWCVTELVTALKEKFSTVSQRLRILRGAGLIVRRREGTHLFYALSDGHVADLIHNALAHARELEVEAAHGDRPDDDHAQEGESK